MEWPAWRTKSQSQLPLQSQQKETQQEGWRGGWSERPRQDERQGPQQPHPQRASERSLGELIQRYPAELQQAPIKGGAEQIGQQTAAVSTLAT